MIGDTVRRAHRPRRRARIHRRLLLSGALVAAMLGAVVEPATGEPPADPPGVGSAGSAATHEVTLVTGDRIEVGDGKNPRVTVLETATGTTAISLVRTPTSVFAIPDQALPLLAADRLDRRLFDVTGLVAQGYGDAATDALPVIIEDRGSPAVAAVDRPGTRSTRALPSADAVATEVGKDSANAFWQSIRPGRTVALGADTSKVWLDARVEADLDRSVPQIGGTAARQRGLDGRGVTVAVLDSGIDTGHPDLAGQVAAARNFTDEADTDDYVGHGTHVASTVAGTGTGSDGKYVGVAPGARLLNAKVLQLEIVDPGIPVGSGRESWIIAGMEWAVDADADIVNLSLGSSAPDGNNPVSRALDRLAARSGALFVVAAGNTGPDHYTIGSPAAADSALAVGSVDRDDAVSSFSGRGPRITDGAVKPEITAPGRDIGAARAEHARVGKKIDDLYSSMSGTSMAAPHVAGAAALVKQQHPDWDSAELRSSLTSTAAFNPAYPVFDQGGGRVDVDRATRQAVTVDAGVLNAGYFPVGAPPQDLLSTKTLTYTNPSDTPVTLDLAASVAHQSGRPVPPGVLTVSPRTLTVPAGSSARAEVRVDVSAADPYAYSGRVLATGPDGVALGTSVGFYKQGTEVNVTFRAVDRNGDPAEAGLIIRNPRAPSTFVAVSVPAGGSHTVRLAPGDYGYLGYLRTPDASGRSTAEVTVLADPELEAAHPNRTIVLDARKGRPLGVQVPRDVDVNGLAVGLQIHRPELSSPMQESLILAAGASYGSLHAVPTSVLPFEPPRRGHGDLDTYWSLVSPRLRATVTAPRRFRLPATLMDGSARVDGTSALPVVDAGAGRPADLGAVDVRGRAALIRETAGLSFTDQARAAADAGAAAAVITAAEPGEFHGDAYASIPVLAVTHDDGERLRRLVPSGAAVIELAGTSAATYLYDLVFRERDRLPTRLVYRPTQPATVQTSYHAGGTKPQRRVSRRAPAWGEVCGYCGGPAREMEDWYGGRRVTEIVTVGTRWQEQLYQDAFLVWEAARSYPRGVTATSWNKGPVAPGVPIAAGIRSVRDGDELRLRLSGFTDADPTHRSAGSRGLARYTSLSRDGEPLGTCAEPDPLTCSVDVPAGPATYTLAADFPASGERTPASRTSWTFGSAAGQGVLPLIDLDYRLPLSLDNTLAAGSRTDWRLLVQHQPGAVARPVDAVRVEASYDDGATWTDLPVQRLRPDWYQVAARQPALADTNGYVALRVTASDPDGNRTVQETRRAYRLTG